MTFITLEKLTPGASPHRVGRLTASRIGKKDSPKARQILFTLSPDIAAATGLKPGAFMDLQLGTGPDTGFLQLQLSTNIAARKMQNSGGGNSSPAFTIIAKVIGALIPEKSIDLPWRIEDGALVIDIRPLMPATAIAAAA